MLLGAKIKVLKEVPYRGKQMNLRLLIILSMNEAET